MFEYKQERISTSAVAARLTSLETEGWQYLEILERIEPPTYVNGGRSGPSLTVVLLRRPAGAPKS